ncbi:hypothetical protein [Flagellimonas onchidii]|uniref:hypothetical protein n=1 Tax=Flagellimonas onchidii TaxID=2562684 RepID=UPI0010A5BD54|nr:hypothetical protein [Allomuricauda onchidii]
MEEHIYKETESANGSPRYTFLVGSPNPSENLNIKVNLMLNQVDPSMKPYTIDHDIVRKMYSHEIGDIDENSLVLSYVYHNYHKKKDDMVSMEAYYLELREYFSDLKAKGKFPFDAK